MTVDTTPSAVWTVLVAAGTGTRFGRPKQFQQLSGRRVLDWALDAARAVSDGVVLVVPPDTVGGAVPGVDTVVPGGPTRSTSVRAGLAAVPAEVDVVIVHDAARPLASVDLFHRVVAAVRDGADAAVPGLAVTDTLKQVGDDGRVGRTVDRAGLVAVQTPQAFAAAVLRKAHAAGGDTTDDAALVEEFGGRVVVVDGEADNFKITWPADLTTARLLLEARAAATE
jgi:2-C-methyl-D-erythritol 4-phosphate cytidylyltransferase